MRNTKLLSILCLVSVLLLPLRSSTIQGPAGPFGTLPFPVMTGVRYVSAFSSNLPVATTDIYTAPAGKRAMFTAGMLFNTSLGNITWSPSVKISGTSYRINADIVTATNAASTFSRTFILEPTESISITASAVGGNIFLKIVEYDSTVRIFTARITAPAAGDTTLYTCPAGRTAYTIPDGLSPAPSSGALVFANSSGGTRTFKYFLVPSGGSSGAGNQMVATGSNVGNNAISTTNIQASFAAGDFLVVNDDATTATQLIYTHIVEL